MERNTQFDLAERYITSTHVSLFLTGKAGTGKTTFLRHIQENVKKRSIVVAPTGVAAVNAGGVTIHSFFQLPFCPFLPDVKELVTEYQMPESQRQLQREKLRIIRTLDLLIIDEISMVRADLLDAIDDTLRRCRRNNQPFGGVQLLMIGDVQQLPPVVTESEKPYMDRVYPSPFFFHSKALKRLEYITIELKKIYRQQDEHFVEILNNIRDNKFDSHTLELLNARYNPNAGNDRSEQVIRLTTHNRQADKINQERMAELTTQAHTFDAYIDKNFPESSAPTDMHLLLKEGAQVMFVKNDSSGQHRYINGTIGCITQIDKDETGEMQITVRKDDGKTITVGQETWENIKYEIDPKDNQIKQKVDGTFTQYPLRLAWAVTIHKAQGLTFDRVVIDAGQAFAYGQVYVALSRCRTLEGLELSSPITTRGVFDNSDVMTFVDNYTPEEKARYFVSAYEVQYFYEILFEMFDFSALERHSSRLNRIFQEKLKGTYPEQAKKMFDLCTKEIADLTSVNERFRRQLTAISQQPAPPINEGHIPHKQQLDDRIAKASQWYIDQITRIVTIMQPLLRIEINNQETLKEFNDQAEQMCDILEVKMICLRNVKEKGFSVDGYLKSKNNYLLDKDAPKKKLPTTKSKPASVEETYGDNRHPRLIPILSRWRLEQSKEIDKPAFVILTQKALLAIADKLPQTEQELLTISGIGKKKAEQYGGEIINLIHDFCIDEGIPIRQHTATFDIPKKEPKRPSWEITLEHFAQGEKPETIAQDRGVTLSTVHNHLLYAVKSNLLNYDDYTATFMKPDEMDILVDYIMEEHPTTLSEVFEHFEKQYTYEKIKAAFYMASTLE